MNWEKGFQDDKNIPEHLEELSRTIFSKDNARNIISSCHLYLEGLLEKIIKLEVGKDKTKKIIGERSNLLEKAKILYALNIINDDTFHDIEIISNLRNKFSHQLKPDIKKLNSLYSSILNTKAYNFANTKIGLNNTSDKVLFFVMELAYKYEKQKQKKSKLKK